MIKETEAFYLQEDGPQVWKAAPETKDEVLGLLKDSPRLYNSFQKLDDRWKQRFVEFCQGKKSLPVTYDPFFKRLFHPDIHPDRLSYFVSSIMGVKVKILRILPNEDSMIDGSTLLIMDLLGELEDGALVNIEIQKQGYVFPAERISCYSSDLVMRQYARVKGVKGKNFTYRDIKKVYVIVLFEKSTKEFYQVSDSYLHHGKIMFDTGLNMEFLQEYFLISLDVFQKFPYPKSRSEQTGWLSFLTTETLKDAECLIKEYPWLKELYQEIAALRQNPKEVLGMFSEALRILDQNTVKYMVEELQKELDEKRAMLEERDAALMKKDTALMEKNAALKRKDMEIEVLRKRLEGNREGEKMG